MNLNILEKDNIICVSLINATMCLNLIIEPNVPNLRNCIYVLPRGVIDEMRYSFLRIYAPTSYSMVFLLYAPAPAPIKVGFSAVRCGSYGCVGEAYTPS